MSRKFHTISIEDVCATDLSSQEQQHLLDLFESAVRCLLPTPVREAHFETADFASARQRGVLGFSLHVVLQARGEPSVWQGSFTRNGQRLDVMATSADDTGC